MQTNYSPEDWRKLRFINYANKLNLSSRKARRRLMLFPLEKIKIEVDKIVDSKYWSCNEPGISYEERKRRFKNMIGVNKPYETNKTFHFLNT